MADVTQETGVAEEAGVVGDLPDEAERTEVADVAGMADVCYVEVEKDEASSVGMREVAEKGDVADLVDGKEVGAEMEDMADLKETTMVAEEEDVADLAETREVAEEDVADLAETREVAEVAVADLAETTEVAKKEDVADLAEAREVAEEEVVADLVEMTEVVEEEDVAKLAEVTEVANEEDVAKLAEVTEVANKEDVADLVEMREVAKEDMADLVEMKEVAKEDVPDLPEMMEVAEEEDVAELPEETYVAGQVVEDGDLPGPVAEETDLAGPVVEETDLAGAMGEETDFAGPVVEETDLGGHVDEREEAVDEANVAHVANETMEAEEDLAEEAMEADEIEAIEMTEMAEDAIEAEEIIEAEEEMEVTEEMEAVEASKGSGGGKRKRGKNSRAPARVPRKKVEEDVCFICFDGGDLVLCDRRGCPKAYHPSCVNRDEAFFRAKGRWNCGWHLCSNCEKNACYMCYTCTFSLCKACIKDSVILCVRGNKGFCETCMKTVTLIEHNLQGNKDMGQVDFDDKSSWEYLFKDYWIDLKERLSLTLDELNHAKNPWKVADVFAGKQESPDDLYDANNDEGSDSDSSGNIEINNSKRRRAKKRLRPRSKEADSPAPATSSGAEGPSIDDNAEWASKELLEFVMHMKEGDRSVLSQFDVQALLLDYIKRNKLRDPRRKSQIICDSRLQSLFGKPRVGHFEMLKLLESHFLIKEDSQVDDLQGSVVDNTEASQLETDGNLDALAKSGRDKKRKTRKKGDERGPQSNVDDYAAIDIHNINLIYLRRNLVEELLEDMEKFHDKVVGTFVRIRISGSGQKQDLYRLVQVLGTCKAAEPYKVGKRMADILLEILNLNKTEIISSDIISNQEFTEDECKRLRQSIKCGLIHRLTVGDIQERAIALQEVRVKDWLETEIVRLSHLRDRASEKGRRKELRECVEKLQLLKTPEERQRRLEEIPEIHADPHMDPSYESEEDEGETDDKRQETYMRPRGTGFSRRAREPVSPQTGGSAFSDSWSGTRNYSDMSRELSRSMSNKGLSYKADDTTVAGEMLNERNQGRDRETPQASSWEKQKIAGSSEIGASKTHSVLKSDTISSVSEISAASVSTAVTQSAASINETEKLWRYQDPSGKIQGPFSMVQLRKWNNTGYFPANLRIWRATERQDDSLLLTDALAGKFQKDPPLVDNSFPKAQVVHSSNISSSYSGKPHGASFQQGMEGQVGERSNLDQNRGVLNSHSSLGSSGQSAGGSWRSQAEISPAGRPSTLSVEVPQTSADGWGSNYRNDSTNLPSPTPINTTPGATKGQPHESKWLHNPVQTVGSVIGAGPFLGANGELQPPAAVIPESAARGSESNGASSHPGATPVPNPEKGMLVGSLNALQMHVQSTVPSSVLADASMSPGADMKNTGTNFHNLDRSVANHNLPIETQGWGSGLVPKPEMTASCPIPGSESQAFGSAPSQKVEPNNPATMPVQPLAHGRWADAPFIHNSAPSFSSGNPVGSFPAAGFSGLPPSEPWRHSGPGNQSNIQPPAPPTLTWGMGVAENQTAGTRPGPENQTTGWGPVPGNHNMGWGGPVPANANINWGPPGQGPAPGNPTGGWAAPVQAPGNAVPGWVPASQGLPLGNTNPGWVAPGQVPPPGNANPGWVAAPTGNPGNNTDRFTNQSVRGSHGGETGYGGGKAWNRQSSFGGGGGGSRPPFKGQRVCKFHEGGHCKKGASCDYLHP